MLDSLRDGVEAVLTDDATRRRAREIGAAMAGAAPVGDAIEALDEIVAQGAASRH